MPQKDSEILSGLQRSDTGYFDLLFENYYDKLCNYVTSIIHNADIAEDLVQDLFATIWVNRKHLYIHSSFKAYLFRAAYNAAIDHSKHLNIISEYQFNISRQTTPSFNDTMEFMELLESLETNIEQLPEKCKEIFKLSRFENLKYREIANKLSISENTVDTQIRRALKKLKEALKDYLIILFFI